MCVALPHNNPQDIDATVLQPRYRTRRIFNKIERVDHVDIRRLGVRHYQDQPTRSAASLQFSAGVAQSRSKSGRETGLEAGQPTACRRPERFVEILHARQPDTFAPIGSEGKKRDRIVRRIKRVPKQRDGHAFHFEYACFPGRFRNVDKYYRGKIAQPWGVGAIDATIRSVSRRHTDSFFHQRINIQIVAFSLAPQPR